MANEKVIVNETVNKVVISGTGAQGPRGKGILNGNGTPSNSLGLQGDFYYDKDTTRFYGPKPNDLSWQGAPNYLLNTEVALVFPWELAQVHPPDAQHPGVYWVPIEHNLQFHPNVTVKASSGDVLETGIDYNSINMLTLTMTQQFSGTAYLS
jgi:hypothetical protein